MTVEELEQMIGHLNWKDFEKTDAAEITLLPPAPANVQREPPVRFVMRVGLHMNRPAQVIIAMGHFVRLRAAPEYEGYELARLDPGDPDNSLYDGLVAIAGTNNIEKKAKWRPPLKLFGNMSEIVNATIRNMTGQLAANMKRNNNLLMRLIKK